MIQSTGTACHGFDSSRHSLDLAGRISILSKGASGSSPKVVSAEAAAMASGFGSLSAFSRAYRAHFGYTARDERKSL
jgi:AraC-like DNA-binding protein